MPREMSARPVPLRPQVDDIVDQRRQSPAHRLAKNERLRESEIRAHAIQRDRERTRHAQLQPHIVRLPRREEIRKINRHVREAPGPVYPRKRGPDRKFRTAVYPRDTSPSGNQRRQSSDTETSLEIPPNRSGTITATLQRSRKKLLKRRRNHLIGPLRRDAENSSLGGRHHTNLIDPEVWFLIDEDSAVVAQHGNWRRSGSILPIGTRSG